MKDKRIIQTLIMLLIVSLSSAVIYAAEECETTHKTTHEHDGIYLNCSGNVIKLTEPVNPIDMTTMPRMHG